ncbi:DUF4012 domain-containing protein, partial [Candidatus Gracilibacteria bacterium]|nr:DUF4012 domain-containing protein [Candidatus Gracilibacteria bacterium]
MKSLKIKDSSIARAYLTYYSDGETPIIKVFPRSTGTTILEVTDRGGNVQTVEIVVGGGTNDGEDDNKDDIPNKDEELDVEDVNKLLEDILKKRSITFLFAKKRYFLYHLIQYIGASFMKFNDIHSNSDGLPEEIDITIQDDTSDEVVLIENSGVHIDTIHDTQKGSLKLSGIKDPQVIHSPTKNFDSIHSAKKLFSSLDASGKPSWHTRLFGSKYLNDHHHVYGRYMGVIQLAAVLFFLACFLWLSKLFVISYVESGYQRLLKLRDDAGNITRMQEHLNDARFDFILADILYFPFQIIPQRDIQNGYHIIKAGKYLTELGDRSFYLYSGISEQIQSRGIEHISYVQLLRNLKTEFEQTQYQLGQAISHYDSIEDLSDGYIAYKIDQANQILKKAYSFNRLLNLNYDAFLDIIGASGPRKYLIVFQNADEIRPTGGFMGSMGIVTIENGQLIDFDKRD